jgi:hypothetical protein
VRARTAELGLQVTESNAGEACYGLQIYTPEAVAAVAACAAEVSRWEAMQARAPDLAVRMCEDQSLCSS